MNQSSEISQKLAAWAGIESFTRDAAGVNRMMDEVAASVAGLPIDIERIAGRDGLGDIVVLKAGSRKDTKTTLLLSHLDTVHPPGTLNSDLPIKIDGDRFYGPGIYDMKGGALLALDAFKAVAGRHALAAPTIFIFTPDEEIGSPTSRQLIETYGKGAGAALVTEPARDGGKIVTARKGVGIVDVTIEGRPAHAGARHERGRSAIREAARQIVAIEDMTDYARGITLNVGVIAGGTARNVVPQACSFEVDFRAIDRAGANEVEKALLGLKPVDPDTTITVTGGLNRPPFPPNEATMRLFDRAREIAAKGGWRLDHVPLTGGGSDGNFTADIGCPTLDGLGIDGDGAHTLQEYALISSFTQRQKLIEGLLETLAHS